MGKVTFDNLDAGTYIWVAGQNGWFFGNDGQQIFFSATNQFINWLVKEYKELKYFPVIEIVFNDTITNTPIFLVKTLKISLLATLLENAGIFLEELPYFKPEVQSEK